METSLHRVMKEMYADRHRRIEVAVGGCYRADAIARGEVVEVQAASLGAIRDKVRDLLGQGLRVLVVKPIVRQTTIVRVAERGGPETSRRRSPKHGNLLNLFDDLVHFATVFPAGGLTLEAVLCDVEEERGPRPIRRRQRDKVFDRRLTRVCAVRSLRRGRDLLRLLPPLPDETLTSSALAAAASVGAEQARRIAYCLHHTGVLSRIGRDRRGYLYALTDATSGLVDRPSARARRSCV